MKLSFRLCSASTLLIFFSLLFRAALPSFSPSSRALSLSLSLLSNHCAAHEDHHAEERPPSRRAALHSVVLRREARGDRGDKGPGLNVPPFAVLSVSTQRWSAPLAFSSFCSLSAPISAFQRWWTFARSRLSREMGHRGVVLFPMRELRRRFDEDEGRERRNSKTFNLFLSLSLARSHLLLSLSPHLARFYPQANVANGGSAPLKPAASMEVDAAPAKGGSGAEGAMTTPKTTTTTTTTTVSADARPRSAARPPAPAAAAAAAVASPPPRFPKEERAARPAPKKTTKKGEAVPEKKAAAEDSEEDDDDAPVAVGKRPRRAAAAAARKRAVVRDDSDEDDDDDEADEEDASEASASESDFSAAASEEEVG